MTDFLSLSFLISAIFKLKFVFFHKSKMSEIGRISLQQRPSMKRKSVGKTSMKKLNFHELPKNVQELYLQLAEELKNYSKYLEQNNMISNEQVL